MSPPRDPPRTDTVTQMGAEALYEPPSDVCDPLFVKYPPWGVQPPPPLMPRSPRPPLRPPPAAAASWPGSRSWPPRWSACPACWPPALGEHTRHGEGGVRGDPGVREHPGPPPPTPPGGGVPREILPPPQKKDPGVRAHHSHKPCWPPWCGRRLWRRRSQSGAGICPCNRWGGREGRGRAQAPPPPAGPPAPGGSVTDKPRPQTPSSSTLLPQTTPPLQTAPPTPKPTLPYDGHAQGHTRSTPTHWGHTYTNHTPTDPHPCPCQLPLESHPS